MEDEEILALYWNRDEDAIGETRAKYGAHLRNLAYNVLKSDADAEECVNDAYLKAWEHIPPERPLPLYPWLARITRNLSFHRLEKQKRQKRNAAVVELSEELAECLPSGDGPERELESARIRRVLNGWLEGQSKLNAFLFVRRYFYGDDYAALARYAGKTKGAVRIILCRMREDLRGILEKEEIFW